MVIARTSESLLYMERPLIQRLINITVLYYNGMRTSVLDREVPLIQSVLVRKVPSCVHVHITCICSNIQYTQKGDFNVIPCSKHRYFSHNSMSNTFIHKQLINCI